MRIVIGLGNPGNEYQKTRHNVGFSFVDYLQTRLKLPAFQAKKKHQLEISEGSGLILLKPQTFMNNSGLPVRQYLDYFFKSWSENTREIVVAHDDLDINFGSYKLQQGKGPKIHNGLLSLYNHLGTQDFWHLRIGIDNRQGERNTPGKDYVLASFTETEKKELDLVFGDIFQELDLVK